MRFVALFRGINVGMSIKIPMEELRQLLEDLGLMNVETYLNSGNALFDSGLDRGKITELIEKKIESQYKAKVPVLIKTGNEIVQIAESIPSEWTNDKEQQTYVAYLFDEVAYPELIDELPIKREFMNIYYEYRCIVWNIKKENYNKSHITKIVGHSSYSRMTTRNSNTARKLAQLCLKE